MDMLIEPQILVGAGAMFRKHDKGQIIFYEGDAAGYYYQIISGSVSIVNVKRDGSEFIQGIFKEGQSFGTAAVLLGEPFPATAVAATDVVLIRLARAPFMEMLKVHGDVLLNITLSLCRKLYQKAFIGKGIASQGPEERITTLLQVLKKESGCAADAPYRLSLSRQQIADMIGLRVETVIRAMKKLEERGTVTITHGKVYY